MTDGLRHTHRDDTSELLSSYLDGALDVGEHSRFDALLRSCPACAMDLQHLRALRQVLRELPVPLAPRSFTVDPAAVHPRSHWLPSLRWATLIAALLLVVVLGVEVLTLRGPAGATATSAEQAPGAEGPGAPPENGLTLRRTAITTPAAGSAASAPDAAATGAAHGQPEMVVTAYPHPQAADQPVPFLPTDAALRSDSDGRDGSGGEPHSALDPSASPTTPWLDPSSVAADPASRSMLARRLRLLEYVLGAFVLALGITAWLAWRREL